ncbi:imidazolone-5-propionate hydrolase [Legionella quinlivanii]|uniref:Imidazolonepropionase n=1 Tax=Legionella quinlivanii TaxID=45073 RepID=A0A0W0XL03_9GAMM|nr:imidazolonepropionase [Legionella quinlivanii]KTD45325.1 imidazolone-5-propionate hydrolase [Legionella quinlivanii]MCW8451381.1 imidazolonepropionase [Legionella quinlivanii]SEG15994.1 imidazolonepropionase [Legionella quinlivanii DSM 21216]STY10419.1 imidazolone-5-propionate hydrolase [Legionella quinlivanii]
MSLTILKNALILDSNGSEREGQSIVISQDKIAWCGKDELLPVEFQRSEALVEDCQGQLITPGLIDCHTHLVYAGDRSREFQRKLEGASYADIAREGGGIVSTVTQTRKASLEELIEQSLPRLLALRSEGVTSIEIKSGYGLDLDNEIKMLKAAKQLQGLSGMRIKTSFLGAHAVPIEYKHNAQAYVDFLCAEVLPAVADQGLADAVDVFCESIGFNLAQAEQIFNAANHYKIPLRCHAEQLSNLGASRLAASMKALSCDHLEYLEEEGAKALGENGTVAVLLPGAYYFLAEKRKPPVEVLRQHGVDIAIATDCNPGSSPTASLLLMMSMACRFFSLSIPEVLKAVTVNAAKALGIHQETGILAAGFSADLVRWSVKESASLCYYFAYPLPHNTMIGGKWLKQ